MKKLKLRIERFYKNDRLEPQHYKSVSKKCQNKINTALYLFCFEALGYRNNIMIIISEKACVSAEIRNGAVQLPVPQTCY